MGKDWRDFSALLVGCGSIGRRHAAVLRGLGLGDIRVCDPSSDQIAQLVKDISDVRVVESFEAGLAEGPDTVFILTPPKLHIPQAIRSVRAGAHVFSEKPLAHRLERFDELADAVEETGLVMMVGLCFRFHEGLLRAKRLVEEGKIGRLVSIRALMGERLPDVRPDYRTLFAAKYLGAFDLVHDLDLALWYAYLPVAEAHAFYGAISDIGITAPDVVEILVRFEGECMASVHLDFFQRARRRQMELLGTEGTIIVEFASWDSCTVSVYEAATERWDRQTIATERNDMFAAEDRAFLQAVAGDGRVECDIHEGARSIAVVEQVYEEKG